MKTVKPENFSRDHWSMLAYIETCCVDLQGRINLDRVRCNPKTHPGLAYSDRPSLGGRRTWKTQYGTTLKDGVKLASHDDHDCANDLEAAGFILHIGTGTHPVYQLTPLGWMVVSHLRQHKAEGGNFANFEFKSAQAA